MAASVASNSLLVESAEVFVKLLATTKFSNEAWAVEDDSWFLASNIWLD